MGSNIVEHIKALQLKIDANKAAQENNKIVREFVRLLGEYPEAWSLIYLWKSSPKPFVIVEPNDFDFSNLKLELLKIVGNSYYLRNCIYSFLEQYNNFENDNKRISKINDFLQVSKQRGFFEAKDEFLLYCSQCGKTIILNKLVGNETCNCGLNFDVKFSLISIPSIISTEIISGHLLELYALQAAKETEGLHLIGMEIQDLRKKIVYTSIEYSDIGVSGKTNGELDLLGIKDRMLIAFECKLNATTYDDIKDFLGTSENLYFKVRTSEPELKLRRVIITYDGSKLMPDGYFVISISAINSTKQVIKEFGRIIR